MEKVAANPLMTWMGRQFFNALEKEKKTYVDLLNDISVISVMSTPISVKYIHLPSCHTQKELAGKDRLLHTNLQSDNKAVISNSIDFSHAVSSHSLSSMELKTPLCL